MEHKWKIKFKRWRILYTSRMVNSNSILIGMAIKPTDAAAVIIILLSILGAITNVIIVVVVI